MNPEDPQVPTKPPTFRTIDYAGNVRSAWGDSWHSKDVSYQFTGRTFMDTSLDGGGPYGPEDMGS